MIIVHIYSLANCFLELDGNNDTSLSVLITNEGVWVYYFRANFSGTLAPGTEPFVSYRRIANRRIKDLVDVAIQIDARTVGVPQLDHCVN